MTGDLAGTQILIELLYLIASVLFILSLKWMSSPTTARHGIWAGEVGMVLAIGGTLLNRGMDYRLIAIALVLGTIIGVPLGRVHMTAVPQRTALSHAFGALCVTLVGSAEFYLRTPDISRFMMAVLSLEVILGGLTVTGSLMAAGKLQEILPQRPLTYKGQNLVNFLLLAGALVIAVSLVFTSRIKVTVPVDDPDRAGVRRVVDYPDWRRGYANRHLTFERLCRSVGGGHGLRSHSKLLIIAGALDGSSGLILSIIMSKAMNRSFTNVLFGAFGQVQTSAATGEEAKPVKSATAEEAAALLSAASRVIVVPGYGMAVAQAQHKVRELYDALSKRGVDVRFAIHPVAGRMPGHMNVLLAEADIPYDRLIEMEEINGDFPQTDVALVIGANDVTNPAARSDAASPIYGMPILDVDRAVL